METLLILSIAQIIDLVFGEPPRALHPVVWIGKIISLWVRWDIGKHPVAQFAYGTAITLVTIGLFAIPAYLILHGLRGINYVPYVVIGAMVFKPTFSLKELWQAALDIKRLLIEQKLDGARLGLRSLVKRETRNLSEPLIVSAAVESVAENTCDSFVAPLFYFLILGIPGAVAYRVTNTLDAMIGYHGEYEYLGKFAARLDDVANFIPARLTALLLVLAAFLLKKDSRAAWQVTLRDHAKTQSPNAGWPMAAVAGALNVQLQKVGHYQLGEPNDPLAPQTIDAALGLVGLSALIWVVICFAVGVGEFVITSWA